MKSLSFEVNEQDAGKRLDQTLRRRLPAQSRRLLRELFADGKVKLNGHPAKKGDIAKKGHVIEVELPAEDIAHANAELALDIAFESEHVVIVNKAAGMPCAPNSGAQIDSVANGLVARYPEMHLLASTAGNYSPREAGLVHRLDTFTSGLLLAARTPAAFKELVTALKSGALTKKYLALAPRPSQPNSVISDSLKPHPKNPKKVCIATPGEPQARQSETRYTVLSDLQGGYLPGTGQEYVFFEVEVGAAYRHQIRVHLASIKCPLLGDLLYGGAPLPSGSGLPPERHALHAHHLSYAGGALLPAFEINSPLPTDLKRLLACLSQG